MRPSFVSALAGFLVVAPSLLLADITLASGIAVAPGQTAMIPVSLGSPAPASGVFVTLSSSDAAKVTVQPASIYIPSGATTPYTQPQVRGVSFGAATINASAYGLVGDSQTVRVAATLSGPAMASLNRGSTQNLTFSLSTPTPTALTLSIVSSNPSIASVPSSVQIPANGTGAIVRVTGTAAGSTVLRIGAPPNVAETTVNLTVVAPGTITLPNVTAAIGRTMPFPIMLGTPAPPTGVVISLSSNKTLTVTISPSSVFVPGGATTPSTQPQITGRNIGAATITATAPGYATASQVVPVPATVTFNPATLTIARPGTTGKLLLALSDSAPWGPDSAPWSNGLTVQLSSSNPNVARVQQSVDFYPDGSEFTTIVVIVNAVGPGTAVIRAGAPPFIPETTATVTVLGSGGASPASITATSGAGQTAAPNSVFGSALAATVKDAAGNPMSGVTVIFTPPGSGASGSFAGAANTAVTNASGVATSASFRANAIPGSYAVSASAAGLATPASFLLTNTLGTSGSVSLPASVTVGPNQSLGFPVNLSRPAPPGGLSVSLTSSDPAKVTVTPANVFIAAGATAPTQQPQVRGVNFGTATVTPSAPGYTSSAMQVQVKATLNFSPANVTFNGVGARSLTLTLSAPAPAGGLAVQLNSSNRSVATVPAAVTFPANSTGIAVPLTGLAVGATAIAASSTAPNVTGATAAVTIKGASDITLGSGIAVAPGQSAMLPVSLSRPAPASGVFVTLSSSDAGKVTVLPASIYIPSGATTPYAQPQVKGVSFGSATINASAYGLVGDSQTVRVSATLFGPAAVSINRGSTQNLTFSLSAPTSTALTLSVVSANPAIASVPSSVQIPANGTAAIVPVTGMAAGSIVLRIGAPPNVAETTVSLTVVAPGTITLPSVTAAIGRTMPFPIMLGTPAPPSGVVISLSSNKTLTVTISPSSVFVPGGATTPSTQPQITGRNIGAATITATAPGYATASQVVPVPATVTFNPATLTIARPGTTGKLLLALSDSAPWGPDSAPWSNGLTVQLSSSNPNVARVQQSVDFYPDGSEFTTIVVIVNAVAPGTAVIRAGAPPFIPETTATVTVLP